jgi:hypothetical protein
MLAAVDQDPMLRHQQRTHGKVEHLARLDPYRRIRPERPKAMLADARLVRKHKIGIGDLPQRAAFVALLPAARLARTAAQAFGPSAASSSTHRSTAAGSCSHRPAQPPAKLGDVSFQLRDPAVLLNHHAVGRSNQLRDFVRKAHSTLDSDSSPEIAWAHPSGSKFRKPAAFRTHPGLGVTARPAREKQETSGYHIDFIDSVCFVQRDRPKAGVNSQ